MGIYYVNVFSFSDSVGVKILNKIINKAEI